MIKEKATQTARSVAISEARTHAQPTTNHWDPLEAEGKLGPPVVGTPWPDLRNEDVTQEDFSVEGYSVRGGNQKRWGVRIIFSKRALWILALISALAYASIARDPGVIKRVMLGISRVLRN